MGLSVRTRFEVFKRDGFTCGYCGRTPDAPGVTLEVDHITPKASGGSDAIENLVTACWDCNHGKAARSLDDRAPSLAQALETTKERARQLEEYRAWQERLDELQGATFAEIWDYWVERLGGRTWSEDETRWWESPVGMPHQWSLERYFKQLKPLQFREAIDVTARKWRRGSLHDGGVIPYFFGVLKHMAAPQEARHDRAHEENERLRDLFLNREAHGFETFGDVVQALWPESY